MNGSTPTPSRNASTPTPFGPPNLWPLSDIGSTCGHSVAEVEPAGGLDGVGVQHSARCTLANHGRHRGEVGDRADLVVDGHHADDGDVAVRAPRRAASRSTWRGGVDADDGAAAALDDLQHGVVLGRWAHRPATDDRADDRRVVALGAAAREDDLAWAAPDDVGDTVPGLVDGPPGIPGEAVRPAGVGEALGEERQHRLDRLRPHRRRRRMIEVHEAGPRRPTLTARQNCEPWRATGGLRTATRSPTCTTTGTAASAMSRRPSPLVAELAAPGSPRARARRRDRATGRADGRARTRRARRGCQRGDARSAARS